MSDTITSALTLLSRLTNAKIVEESEIKDALEDLRAQKVVGASGQTTQFCQEGTRSEILHCHQSPSLEEAEETSMLPPSDGSSRALARY